ncbi:MAG: glycosyltransferase [Ignavibacteriales bacterium]|nr:glycosyltransferase [Ignavibacteriales bacterium]
MDLNFKASSLNPKPPISIIIPTLQEEKILAQTLNQFTIEVRERYNLEVIVSDGGSNDGTINIAERYNAKVFVKDESSKENISIGRNRGAKYASGEIFIFINADVRFEEVMKFFSTIESTFRDSGIIAATCNVNIYPELQRKRDWVFHNFFNAYFWVLNLIGMGMGRGECHIIRKDAFFKSGGYNGNLAAGEDYDLFMRLKRFGKVKYLLELTVFESPRRFRKYGYLWISLLWFLNAVSVLLFRRSVVDSWKPIR